MPGTDLLLFAELQAQRLRAALISAAPRQTFTAQPKVNVYHLVAVPTTPKIHRGGRPRKPLVHGTVHGYQRYGCKCADCCEARRAYVVNLAARKAAVAYRSYVTSLMEEC